MEKAVLKTLIYRDIFDYPLTIFEIHRWLISRKANLRQVEVAVGRLVKNHKCKVQNGYHFLPGRSGTVSKRAERARQSKLYFRKAFLTSQLLKLIPWIKLVGISGGLAMENAGRMDDIDLVLITSKKRLWISRLLTLGILELTGQRRKVSDSKVMAAGKVCCNLILEEDYLEQKNKNIYTVHEVLQMKVLWQRGNIYSKYLSDNEWVFKFLPNWVGSGIARDPAILSLREAKRRGNLSSNQDSYASLGMTLENLAKRFQLKIMKKPKGKERIEKGALYFHPFDYSKDILKRYKLEIEKLK